MENTFERPRFHVDRDHGRTLLAILTFIVGVFFLKAAADVLVPLVFATFLVGVFWPVYRAVDRVAPRAVAAFVTFVAWIVVVAAFVAGLWFAADQIGGKVPEYEDQFAQMKSQATGWLDAKGLPTPGEGGGSALSGISTVVGGAAKAVFGLGSGFVLVSALLILGLLDAHGLRDKLGADRGDGPHVAAQVARDFRRWFLVRTVVGLINAVAIGIATWAIGLDMPFVWAFATFLLNYIHTIGSIAAVVPPVLFAAAQHQSLGQAALAFGVIGGLQAGMGAVLDPLLSGKYLKLSPVVVLLSVMFWGWVWGIPGAFLGVPIAIVAVLVCQRFDRTKWISRWLAESPAETETREA